MGEPAPLLPQPCCASSEASPLGSCARGPSSALTGQLWQDIGGARRGAGVFYLGPVDLHPRTDAAIVALFRARRRPRRKRETKREMPLLDLTVRHGRTLGEAQRGLETAIHRVSGQFRGLV